MRLATPRIKRAEMMAALRSRDREDVSAWFKRAGQLFLAAAALTVPLVFNPRTMDPFNLPKLTVIWLFAVLGIGAWWFSANLADTGARSAFRPSPLVRLALALLLITALATAFSPNPVLSFHGAHQRSEGLASIAIYVVVLLLVYALFRDTPNQLRDIPIAIGLSTALGVAYIIIQRVGLDPVEWIAAETLTDSPIGSLGNSSFTASFLGIAAPILVFLGFTSRIRLVRAAWIVTGAGTAYALWLTQGRAGMVGAITGTAVLALFVVRRIGPVIKVSLVAVAFVIFGTIPALIADPQDRTESVFRAGTAAYRVEVWKAALPMTAARPVLGWGPESFQGQYGHYRTDIDAQRLGLRLSDKPHNIFLNWSATTGLLGVGLYVALAGTALFLAARVGRRESAHGPMAAAFAGGLVAYLMQGLYSIDVPPLAFMGWLMMGSIAALAARKRGETERRRRWARLARLEEVGGGWPLRVMVGALIAALLVLGLRPVRADHAVWAAESGIRHRWSNETMAEYEKAKALNPLEARYRSLAAVYLFDVATDPATPFAPRTTLLRSASLFQEALDIDSNNVVLMMDTARAYARIGFGDVSFYPRADDWMRRAVERDPRNPEVRDLYASILRLWAQRAPEEQAGEIAARAATEQARGDALR